MLKRRLWAPLVLLSLLWGCGGSQTNLKAKEYNGRLEDKEMALSFQCPATWEVRENVSGHRAIARSPLESPQDDFQENMVITGPLKGSLQEVHDRCESEFKKLQDYKPLSSPPDILDFEHQRDGMKLHCRAYLEPRPAGDFWMVSFTSTAKDFQKHEAEFVAIMSTFGKPLPELPPTPTPGVSGTPAASPTAAASATPTAAALATPTSSPLPATPVASSTPAPAPAPAASGSATPTARPTPRP